MNNNFPLASVENMKATLDTYKKESPINVPDEDLTVEGKILKKAYADMTVEEQDEHDE